MNRRKLWVTGIVGAVIGLAAVAWTSKPAGFHDQYITLPSGLKAFCNEQGYRQIGGQMGDMVTDPKGNFVACDAKIGPEWDSERTGADGHLLTAQEKHELYQEKQAQASAEAAQQHQQEVADMAARQAMMDRCHYNFYIPGVTKDCAESAAAHDDSASIPDNELED